MTRKLVTIQDGVTTEISWAFANEVEAALARPLPATHEVAQIFEAVRAQWPKSNPAQWRVVTRRWLCYAKMPTADAVKAICAGYSSPAAAMRAHVIKSRKMTCTIEETP